MTYEKGGESPIQQRTDEQYLATWTSMFALADEQDGDPAGTGRQLPPGLPSRACRGELEPNQVFEPGNTVEREVPDETVRHYFIEVTGDKAAEARALVRRLQRMDVDVRRLTKPLTVPGYKRYGEPRATRTLPKGTYWVPMAQAQKHWIQAMLGEDSYVPFPYFYDVTAWSGPLLYNVPGRPHGRRAPAEVGAGADPPRAGRAARCPARRRASG